MKKLIIILNIIASLLSITALFYALDARKNAKSTLSRIQELRREQEKILQWQGKLPVGYLEGSSDIWGIYRNLKIGDVISGTVADDGETVFITDAISADTVITDMNDVNTIHHPIYGDYPARVEFEQGMFMPKGINGDLFKC